MNEGDGSIEVCAVLTSGSLERTVTFNLSTREDSAKDPFDFSAVAVQQLQFNKTNSEACTEISIANDSTVEDQESFTLVIRSGGEGVNVNKTGETSTVIITDNDKVEIGLERGKYLQIEEGRTVEVCAALKNATLERVLTIRLKDGIKIGSYTQYHNRWIFIV